jgi:hypothetical protein
MANLIVSAVSEWNGKALKKGQQDINAFEQGVNKLGRALLGVFAAQKLAAFGKASVQAFLADEAAATKLSVAVKNLGLSLSNTGVTEFIGKLEKQTGILDEQLRPAFQGLLTTTGDVVKSQELLKNAIDISRGSTVDLATVSQDLSNAYVGNMKGLKKYNLGLTATQLKAASFTEIMTLLNKQFSGASAAYLDTYSGKVDILKVASDNAKESIGKGLVDALILAGGKDANVMDVADAMNTLADNTSNAIRGVGVLIGKLDTLGKSPGGKGFFGTIISEIASANMRPFQDLANLGKSTLPKPTSTNRSGSPAGEAAKLKQIRDAKALADAKNLKIQQELNKAATAKALKDKLAAQAAKVALLFNQTAISATAALQGKLTEEERNKVLLMLALEMDNTKEADKLAQKVALASDQTGLLAQFLRTLPDAANPFAAWDTYLSTLKTDSLSAAQAVAKAWRDAYDQEAQAKLNSIAQSPVLPPGFDSMTLEQQIAVVDTATADALAAAAAAQVIIDSINASGLITNVGDAPAGSGSWNGFSAGANGPGGFGSMPAGNGGFTPGTTINLTVNNPMGNDGVTMVQNAVLDVIRLGNNLTPAGSLGLQ